MTPIDPFFLLIPILQAAQPVNSQIFIKEFPYLYSFRQMGHLETFDQRVIFLRKQHQDCLKGQKAMPLKKRMCCNWLPLTAYVMA